PSSRALSTDTSTSGFSTVSLHDALPISDQGVHTVPRLRRARNRARLAQRQTLGERGLSAAEVGGQAVERCRVPPLAARRGQLKRDRKSTRLNSSHVKISYAVFCLKKKNN